MAILGIILVSILLFGQMAFADANYPARPITIIVPWSVGGVTDLTVRSLTPIVQSILGVPVVVNNMPGGSSAVGSEFVNTARPDGYTILFATNELAIFQV
ncbi:MAG: tripartite tricarboxylate transporter substrate binding protein, partial [Candidatus Atribacteria bacterium]|nr:tripartite tricarboxylate transporter substrate binding protein [Candidatus Atribacteria bacterium]